jgi:ATP-binding cassette, subfamily B, bacterial PglK
MLKLIRDLFSLLSSKQRKNFYLLQVLVVLMSFMEILGVASIIPFMALVGDISQLQEDTFAAKVYQASGINSESQFLFLTGFGVLVMLFLSSIVSMFTTWKMSMFATKVGAEISAKLFNHYLKQDWLFHSSSSSAQLTKKVAVEASRVAIGIVMPLMNMNARMVLSLFMGATIFIYDPMVATIGVIIFMISYFVLFKLVRLELQRNGKAISDTNEERFRLMNEGFGGIKEVLLMGRDFDFIDRFNKTSNALAYSQGTNVTLTQVPRYLMELVTFGSMIALVLYLIVNYNGDLGVILPILSVYALAGFKLLPSFQLIYTSLARIKGNSPGFTSIQKDLTNSLNTEESSSKPQKNFLHLKKQISFEDVTFTYPGNEESAVHDLNITIPVNSVIGIVGPSGSGKSTLIDILLGLINPEKGSLCIDNEAINNGNRRSWQNTIGFVAQNIFLSEGTIAENVAFGVPKNEIDLDKVYQALELAHLSDLIKGYKDGIDTKVGERGVQLSGGQCQRIGIARSLYHNAEILIFDEATSSLDGITERMIMEAIHNFSGKKTIIMIAHRLKTVQKCDKIFFLDKGNVIDEGTYSQLIETNEHFRNMAEHA